MEDVLKLTKKQDALITLLMTGAKLSVADICIRLHYSDPRVHIRKLRKLGFPILDEWRKNVDGDGRYKVYFINQEFK